MSNPLVSHKKLEDFIFSLFNTCGLSKENARITANNMVLSNLYGIDSHGVIRAGIYLEKLKSSAMNLKPKLTVCTDAYAFKVIDGDNAPGAIVGAAAMEAAIQNAEKYSIGFCGAIKSNHFGAAGHYARQAVERGMIGIAISNVAPLMGMPGISGPVVGNNPMAFGIPTGGEFPMVLDIALSNVALGKILVAEKEGKSIPEDWAVDQNGNPTSDPSVALKGSLMPIARHKGFGLALVVDILCGVLSGGGFLDSLNGLYSGREKPGNISHMMIAVKPPSNDVDSLFIDRMKMFCEMLSEKDSKENPGSLMLPGKIEYDTYKKRISEGIPLSITLIEELNKIGNEFGVKDTLNSF